MDILGKLRIVFGVLVYLILLITVIVVIYPFYRASLKVGQGYKFEYKPLPGLRNATGKTIPIDPSICGCENCALSGKTCWSGVGFKCSCE